MSARTRVMLIDHSVVVRKYLADVITRNPQLEVSGVALSGQRALAALADQAAGLPDVVVLDLELPERDSPRTLRELRRLHPRLPIILCGSLTRQGASEAFAAMDLGADDFIAKPPPAAGLRGREEFEALLLAKLQAYGGGRATASAAARAPLASLLPAASAAARAPLASLLPATGRRLARVPATRPLQVVGIGVSAGGPNALAQLLPALAPDFPVPILVVQHMPALFTRLLARRMDQICSIKVCEAEDGQPLYPGTVYLAPGDFHMEVGAGGGEAYIRLSKGAPEHDCRPAVDPLLRSLVQHFGGGVLAAILTGIGRDGLRGCRAVRSAGGEVIVQDEASSMVWGMPGLVANAGLADEVLPLGAVAEALSRRVLRGRSPLPRPSSEYA